VSIEGVFAIAYGGNTGLGLAVIKVTDGQVFGHDFVWLVEGMRPQELPHSRRLKHKFPRDFGDGKPQYIFLPPGMVR
jgi:hypothetical protein